MSNHPEGFTGTNMDARSTHESEMADYELDRIVSFKRELMDTITFRHMGVCRVSLLRLLDLTEEAFDEAYYKAWHEQRAISGSIGWPAEIPPRALLSFVTPVEKADAEWKQSAGGN